jgi:hypothetical protein
LALVKVPFSCCIEDGLGLGERGEQTVIAIIKTREDGSLDLGGGHRAGEKGWDFEYYVERLVDRGAEWLLS